MLRYYGGAGMDVLDFHRDLMTPRRLAALVNGLPPESATRYAMAHPEDETDSRWTDLHYMLAHQCNLDQAMFRLGWTGWNIKGKPPAFSDIMPPGVRESTASADEIRDEARQAKLAELRKKGSETNGFEEQQVVEAVEKPTMEALEALREGARKSTPLTPQLEAMIKAHGKGRS